MDVDQLSDDRLSWKVCNAGFEWTEPVLPEDLVLVSLGYASQLYLPQAFGGDVFE
ncbi:MAG: hypothetical protein ACOYOB_19360 [Myxococcota bacterium]